MRQPTFDLPAVSSGNVLTVCAMSITERRFFCDRGVRHAKVSGPICWGVRQFNVTPVYLRPSRRCLFSGDQRRQRVRYGSSRSNAKSVRD